MIHLVTCLLVIHFGLGSELGYLWQLAKGQVALLWKARPIEKIIAEGSLSVDQLEKLALIEAIRTFARNQLSLEPSQNYMTFVDIGTGPVSWNLIVCPKHKLEPVQWSYPIVGTVPYRGYFAKDEAEKARDQYIAEGYDTYLRPISVYSTLGWFSDPILSTMLRYSEASLADLVIHELTHATVWIEDDVTFNESLASFVGEVGATMWLQQKYGETSDEVHRVYAGRKDGLIFRKFMHGISSRLDSLYDSNSPIEKTLKARQDIFKDAKRAFLDLPLQTDWYTQFPSWKLNNARLALYQVYQERTDIFERVYTACNSDLKATMLIFQEASLVSDPAQWLENWLVTHQ